MSDGPEVAEVGDRAAALRISGYDDVVEIGRGGFAVVHRARRIGFDQQVAIKVLDRTTVDAHGVARLARERQILGLLAQHPNVVTLYDAGTTADGAQYLVMEYLPGGSLGDRLTRQGPLDADRVVDIGVRLCGALETAHRAGVLHRDIKPDNVLVSRYGEPVLADFGIARVQGGMQTKSGVVTATVAHAPPEVLDGEPPTERSDLYSLASTLFTLLAGSPPFSRTGEHGISALLTRVFRDPVPDLRPRGVPPEVCALLERAMAKDAAGRPAGALELGRAFQELQRAAGSTVSALVVEEIESQEIESPAGADDRDADPDRTVPAGGTTVPVLGRPTSALPATASPVPVQRVSEAPEAVVDPAVAPRRRRRRLVVLLVVAALGLAAAVVVPPLLELSGGPATNTAGSPAVEPTEEPAADPATAAAAEPAAETVGGPGTVAYSAAAIPAPGGAGLEVLDFGFSSVQHSSGGWVIGYGLRLRNPNPSGWLADGDVTIRFVDHLGVVLAEDVITDLELIGPGQVVGVAPHLLVRNFLGPDGAPADLPLLPVPPTAMNIDVGGVTWTSTGSWETGTVTAGPAVLQTSPEPPGPYGRRGTVDCAVTSTVEREIYSTGITVLYRNAAGKILSAQDVIGSSTGALVFPARTDTPLNLLVLAIPPAAAAAECFPRFDLRPRTPS